MEKYIYGPAAIFTNRIPGLDANFINPGSDYKYSVSKGTDEIKTFGGYSSADEAAEKEIGNALSWAGVTTTSSTTSETNTHTEEEINNYVQQLRIKNTLTIGDFTATCNSSGSIGMTGETTYSIKVKDKNNEEKYNELAVGNEETNKKCREAVNLMLAEEEAGGDDNGYVAQLKAGKEVKLPNGIKLVIGSHVPAGIDGTKMFYIKGTKPAETSTQVKESTAGQLQSSISTWYKTLRLIAIVGLLSVLVYVGIRILISSTGQEKAKYKKMLTDWVAAMCILFLLQYVMVFTMEITESVTGIFASKNSTGLFNTDGSDRLISTVRGAMKSDKVNGYENASFMDMFSWLIIYIVLVIYTCVFTWQYLKRVVMLGFLTMIAPLIALTYPIDKIKDGQAQAFSMWLREYVFNALLPVIHVIIYYMLVSSAIDFITTGGNWLYAIVAVGFMIPAEKFFRKMFGFDKASSVGQLGAAAGGAMVMNAINKMKTGGSGGGIGGNSGDSKPVRPRYIPGPGEGRTQTETGQRTSGGRNPAETQPGDSDGGNTVPGAPEVPQNGGTGTNPSGGTPIDSESTETGAGSATTGGSMFGESVLGTPEKPTIRKAGFNRVISGVAANAHQRYFNKQNAKKWGRRARKGAVKTLGAAALGTFGLAAGIASGDPTNAFKYGAAAAAVGAKGADTLDEKAMKSAKENKEGIQENILGTNAFNMNKATKELNSDLDFVRTCDELGMTKKEREEAVRQFHANGITNAEDIKNAMDIRVKNKEEGENVSQEEVIAATKLHKKLSKSYWGQPANKEKFKKELMTKGANEVEANKAIRLISDLKGDLS